MCLNLVSALGLTHTHTPHVNLWVYKDECKCVCVYVSAAGLACLITVCVCVCVFLQGADKNRKGPDGLSAFEAAENEAIRDLLKWDGRCRQRRGSDHNHWIQQNTHTHTHTSLSLPAGCCSSSRFPFVLFSSVTFLFYLGEVLNFPSSWSESAIGWWTCHSCLPSGPMGTPVITPLNTDIRVQTRASERVYDHDDHDNVYIYFSDC